MTDDVAESGGNKRTLGLTLAGGLLVGFLIAWLIFRSPGYETIDIGKHVGATSDEVDFVFSYNGCKKPGCTDWPALKLENVPPGFMCSSCGGDSARPPEEAGGDTNRCYVGTAPDASPDA